MIPNSLIAAASFAPNSIHLPIAWLGHSPFASWVVREISPKIFVELGTHIGNSYFSFCQSIMEAGLATRCYAVDTWVGEEHAEKYGEEIFNNVHAYNFEHYEGFSQLLRMTFDDALDCFAGESIDLLHIDGLHTYEAVHHDFNSWLPKLAPGAVVLFHDTNVYENNFGVWKLWKEIKDRYPSNLEFVHSHGLGVLQLNNAPDNKKIEWLQPLSRDKQMLVNYFAALGLRQEERQEIQVLQQRVDKLNRMIAERDRQITDLYHSSIWRMTQPLRFVGAWLKKSRRLPQRNGQAAKGMMK